MKVGAFFQACSVQGFRRQRLDVEKGGVLWRRGVLKLENPQP